MIMKSLNNYIVEATKTEHIAESKQVDSVSLADDFVYMTLEDNDAETIEDDIEIFLDKVEEELHNKDQAVFQRFRKAVLNHAKKY